jgi:hypothetical protein
MRRIHGFLKTVMEVRTSLWEKLLELDLSCLCVAVIPLKPLPD